MNEDDARAWIATRFGPSAEQRIAEFVDRVLVENQEQNLISPSTVGWIWSRHVVDSAQLLRLVPQHWNTWIDVGTGGGFPGMVVALLEPERVVTMIEPRGKRAAFLHVCIDAAGLQHAAVLASKVEAVSLTADVISARAVASLQKLLRSAGHCAHAQTTWLLPRGRSGVADVPSCRSKVFHVEQSITDPLSVIVVGQGTMQ